MELSEIMFRYVSTVTSGLIIVMNLIEIIAIFKTNRRKTLNAPMILILNLSISDLFVGLSIAVLKVIYFIRLETRHSCLRSIQDAFTCYAVRLSLTISLFSLITLTIVRFWAVKRPMQRYKFTRRIAFRLCIFIWILASVVMTAWFLVGKFYMTEKQHLRYDSLMFSIFTYPATVIFCISYYVIIKTLRNNRPSSYQSTVIRNMGMKRVRSRSFNNVIQSRVMQRMASIGKHMAIPAAIQSENNLKKISSLTISNQLLESKVFKLVGYSVLVFIVCWLPISTNAIFEAVGFSTSNDLSSVLCVLALWNSILNPLLYFSFIRTNVANYIRQISCFCCVERDSKRQVYVIANPNTSENNTIKIGIDIAKFTV